MPLEGEEWSFFIRGGYFTFGVFPSLETDKTSEYIEVFDLLTNLGSSVSPL